LIYGPGPLFTTDGSDGGGRTFTTNLTIWMSPSLFTGDFQGTETYTDFWYTDDGQVDEGIDNVPIGGISGNLPGPGVIAGAHSYTIPITLPLSSVVDGPVCCEQDPITGDWVLVPGHTVTIYQMPEIILEVSLPPDVQSAPYWVTWDDLTPPDRGALPEPTGWALLLCGFGLLGQGLRLAHARRGGALS
jgi:hypothetical protein